MKTASVITCTLTDRQRWRRTRFLHDDVVTSMTEAAAETTDDTTARQPPYRPRGFLSHKHQ